MPANMTLCRGVGYRSVRLPNLFGQETLQEAAEQADSWVLLVNIHCQPDTQVFYKYLHILSEWASSFLTVHQHIVGHWVLCEMSKQLEEMYNQSI